MREQAVKQVFESKSLEVALEALGKSIARWTAEDGPLLTAIPEEPRDSRPDFVAVNCLFQTARIL
jgi:hypothetical protein